MRDEFMSSSSREQSSILGLVSSFLRDDGHSSAGSAQKSSAPSRACPVAPVGSEEAPPAQAHSVILVIFSKDRPWQLQQLFQSMCFHESSSDSDGFSASLIVLAHIAEEYRAPYIDILEDAGNVIEAVPDITLTILEEDAADSSTFQSLLESIVTEDGNPTHWMFLTDDSVLLVSLRTLLRTATSAFALNPGIQCFLSRLHPGITWTQTRDLPSPPPRSFLRYYPSERYRQDAGVYVYPRESGELDWAYPWDMSGGVYPHSVVQAVFQQLRGTDGLSHPNRMEIMGNKVIAAQKQSLIAVPTYPMMLILAINRVQAVCQAPLACSDTVADTLSPKMLLSLYTRKKHLDVVRYRSLHFNSSHIGELFLLSEPEGKIAAEKVVCDSEECEEPKPALSILIPVHIGPAQAATHAMLSIAMQPVEEYQEEKRRYEKLSCSSLIGSCALRLSPMQIVIVDDRCADGSINAMLKVARKLSNDHPFVSVTFKDCRFNSETAEAPSPTGITTSMRRVEVELTIEIVSSLRPGIAAALNHGLSYCKSDLVARMDADDVAAPCRFLEQVAALTRRSGVTAVGTCVVLFRKEQDDQEDNKVLPEKTNSTQAPTSVLPYSSKLPNGYDSTIGLLTSLPPTDAGFAAWAMLFSCAIAHPSIVYRRRAIVKLGGYNESYSCAEDYDLWLRMTRNDCSSLVSIPRIGLWHRKHRSRARHVAEQADEACRASIRSIQHLLKGSDWSNRNRLSSATKRLRKPDTANSLSQLDEAAELLLTIEAAFLQHHKETLTSREAALVRKDCDARVGELATLAVERFARDSSAVKDSIAWRAWCERCPQLTMNRVALLCHNYNTNFSL